MNIDQLALNQVATTLARHFDSMYYIEIESGKICEFMPAKLLKGLNIPKDAVEAVLRGNAELRPIYYRARNVNGKYVLLTTRGFVLNDKDGNPEYFGGIIIPQ